MVSNRRVWIAQCLCPDRHCMMALAGDDPEEAEPTRQRLRQMIELLVHRGGLNPWCAICGARAETWRYEVAPTRYATLDEAMPHLQATQEDNALANAVFGDLHRGTKH